MKDSPHDIALDLLDTQRGLRVIKVTFLGLLLTAVVEGAITYLSGSAGLLADTIHGMSNALTTLPLWIAFSLSRRRPNNEYPYGYHRAEDLAGIVILVFIALTAVLVGYESVRKLIAGNEVQNIYFAMAAGALSFLANEGIAQYRIRVGKQIASAALVADGHHARVDGLGSLAVVVGLIFVLLGFPAADPLVGLVITGLIVYLLVREAGPMVLSRVMDRMDPSIVTQIGNIASEVPGVRRAYEVRARWAGHRLLAELTIGVAADLSVAQGHRIAEQVQHRLMHSVSKFQWGSIHVVPFENGTPPDLEIIGHHLPERELPE